MHIITNSYRVFTIYITYIFLKLHKNEIIYFIEKKLYFIHGCAYII